MPGDGEIPDRTLVAGLVVVGLVVLLTAIRYQPPAPASAEAPAAMFSAARARAVLQRLLADGSAHPIGSDSNRRVRQCIEAELARLGYGASVQRAFVCSDLGTCGTVENVVARAPGRKPGAIILIAAHYDSVGAGPGASDDGAGVAAILEIARALRERPLLDEGVILLFTDGEEPLLLGSRAFVTEHPWAADVRVAVNLDAGGSSGPSVLLRTSTHNLSLMSLYARTISRPVTSSFLGAGFRQTQHNTDFDEFTRSKIEAFDFAYFGNRLHYHTALDNAENADVGSLQHLGNQGLALVRALATDGNLPGASGADVVSFDLFAARTLWWPIGWTRRLALASTVGILLTVAVALRRRTTTPTAIVTGLVLWIGSLAMALASGLVLSRLLRATHAVPGTWIANPWPAVAASAALGIATSGILVALAGRRAGYWGSWAGIWIGWALLAFAIGWPVPEASYVAQLPLVVAVAGGIFVSLIPCDDRSWKLTVTVLLPASTAAAVVIPAGWFLYSAAGTQVFPLVAVVASLLSTTMFPLMACSRRRWTLSATSGVIGVLSTITAVAESPYSVMEPQGVNITYHQDADSGTARWLLSSTAPLTESSWPSAAGLVPISPALPWPSDVALAKDAPRLDLPAPEFTVIDVRETGSGYELRGDLHSPRGAAQASLMFPPTTRIESVTMHRTRVQIAPRFLRQSQGWRTYTCLTLPPEGVEIRLVIASRGPIDGFVVDQSPGVPPVGNSLIRARPIIATPFQDGDVTLVTRRVRLGQ